MKKSIIAVSISTAILLSLLASMLYKPITAAEAGSEYMTMNGILTSDKYWLYPYQYKSLDFGLSKYGEMIDGTDGLPDVGLQYPGYEVIATYDQRDGTSRDPFANEEISRNLWLNGWLLEARYTHRTYRDRRVLAMAMFADMTSFGGNWSNGHALPLESLPSGGRKTTAYAETESLQVLYDGPREFIVLSVTHLYDWNDANQDGVVQHPDETWAILDIKLTFRFNKVKKEVMIYKDIKLVISGKELDSPIDVQFSNREQWDLGPAPDWHSYAHFYHQEKETCYGPEWHSALGIMREYIYRDVGPISGVPIWDSRDPYGPPIVDASVRLYVNGEYKEEGIDYDLNHDTGAITWHISVSQSDEVEVVYKLWKHEPVDNEWGEGISVPYDGVPHLYDVAQIISDDSPNPLYFGWKAFWPTLSDYTVDGWSMSFIPLINISQPDIIPSEPEIPFVVGEWDFMLGKQYPHQFRGVEVLGLTDWHDADDANAGPSGTDESWSNGLNVMDREAKYQLDEVFNPMDLVSAVHKQTKRWVEFTWGTTWTSEHTPVITVTDENWDQYCASSERVIDLTTDTLLNRWRGDYNFDVVNGHGYISGLTSGHYYKILYSTKEEVATGVIQLGLCLDGSGSITSGNWTIITSGVANAIRNNLPHDGTVELTVVQFADTASVEIQPTLINSDAVAETLAATIEGLTQMTGGTAMADGLYLTWNATKNSARFLPGLTQVINVATDGDPNVILSYTPPASWGTPPGSAAGDVTYVRDNAVLEGLDEIDAEGIGVGASTLEWMRTDLVSPQPGNIAPPFISGWVQNVADAAEFTDAVAHKLERLVPWPRGRYEWVTVGRDAASVDSVGAALISEAFDSEKQIRTGIAGEDMLDPEIANQIPWVMAKFGAYDEWADYYFNQAGLYVEEYRTALKDDWCTYWPITSSNMIGVGGPIANLLAYYGNDFTDAFFGLKDYSVDSPYYEKIAGISCWNRGWNGTWNAYESDTDTGYAVISTYMDINGTVLFLVWGHWGRDTFYASQWFHGDAARGIPPGIVQLQDAPEHLTSIILKIDYTDQEHPDFSIVECLGTISETEWTHGDEVKGGIHDP